jgi:hypothetical protein
MTNPDIRAALERLVELEDAKGPAPAIANAWTDAIAAALAALAEPVGEGPSKEEVLRWLRNDPAWGVVVAPTEWRPEDDATLDLIQRAVARWGHPATPPAPKPGEVGPSDEEIIRFADSLEIDTCLLRGGPTDDFTRWVFHEDRYGTGDYFPVDATADLLKLARYGRGVNNV